METESAAYQNKKKLKLVLALTLTYLIAEVAGGILTNSLALLADAGHMLTDVAGLAFALFAINTAHRSPSRKYSYGYYRTEILAALANALVLIGISFYILYEAWQRFLDPPDVAGKPMLIVASIGLLVNIIGTWILHEGSKESLNMKGAYFEVLSDMLTSIGVIVAAIIMWTTGWYYADPILSAAIGLFILPRVWVLLKDAVEILLEATPKDIDLEELETGLRKIEGVKGLHDLHVWTLTSGVNALSVHLVIRTGLPNNAILKTVQDYIAKRFNITHTTIQLEEEGHQDRQNLF